MTKETIFPFLYDDVIFFPSYRMYISQLIRYARVFSRRVLSFNERNFCITGKLLSQGFHWHELIKPLLNSFIDSKIQFGSLAVEFLLKTGYHIQILR